MQISKLRFQNSGTVFQDLTQNTIVAKHCTADCSDGPLSDVRFFIFCSPGSVQIAYRPSNTDKEQTDPDGKVRWPVRDMTFFFAKLSRNKMDSYRSKSVYRAINCNISHDKEKPDLTPSTHVFRAFNSESLAFTSISFRDLPRLYDIIGGSL